MYVNTRIIGKRLQNGKRESKEKKQNHNRHYESTHHLLGGSYEVTEDMAMVLD